MSQALHLSRDLDSNERARVLAELASSNLLALVRMRGAGSIFVTVLGCFALRCADPVRDQTLESLGEENPAVPEGPLHRPGQPCLVCHGGDGPAEGEFSLAGTVYQRPVQTAPLHDARVSIIDSTGLQYSVVSNCAGNFWARAENFQPVWPVWVKVSFGEDVVEMTSAISREGSCSGCHEDPASPSSPGHVYFADETVEFVQQPCP